MTTTATVSKGERCVPSAQAQNDSRVRTCCPGASAGDVERASTPGCPGASADDVQRASAPVARAPAPATSSERAPLSPGRQRRRRRASERTWLSGCQRQRLWCRGCGVWCRGCGVSVRRPFTSDATWHDCSCRGRAQGESSKSARACACSMRPAMLLHFVLPLRFVCDLGPGRVGETTCTALWPPLCVRCTEGGPEQHLTHQARATTTQSDRRAVYESEPPCAAAALRVLSDFRGSSRILMPNLPRGIPGSVCMRGLAWPCARVRGQDGESDTAARVFPMSIVSLQRDAHQAWQKVHVDAYESERQPLATDARPRPCTPVRCCCSRARLARPTTFTPPPSSGAPPAARARAPTAAAPPTTPSRGTASCSAGCPPHAPAPRATHTLHLNLDRHAPPQRQQAAIAAVPHQERSARLSP